MNITFKNMSVSLCTANAPKWQSDIIKRINHDYQEKAVETSEQFRASALEALQKAGNGYVGTAIDNVMRNLPRYEFIKAVTAPDGGVYDVMIDLLLHTVSFGKI